MFSFSTQKVASSTSSGILGRLFKRNDERKTEESLPIQEAQSAKLVQRAKEIYKEVPDELTDAIFTSELFVDPALTKHGHVFERHSLVSWLKSESRCPKTNNKLESWDLENQTRDDKIVEAHIQTIIKDYTKARARFLKLINSGQVTENDIVSYQSITVQTVEDFQLARQSVSEAEIDSQLNISYRRCCFPKTVELFDDFCLQVPVLTDNNEWVPKSCASSFTEYKEITDDLWNLNNKLIELNTAILNEPSNQLQTKISQLDAEYKRILLNMEAIKKSKNYYPSKIGQSHAGLCLFPDEKTASADKDALYFWEISGAKITLMQDVPSSVDSPVVDPSASRDLKDEVPARNNINDRAPQSSKCTCSLFLKIISAVALVNGILLLIILNTPTGGIISLCVGGFTLFVASREKKPDEQPKISAVVHPASP